MPVASMSILPRTGMVQVLATPGNFIAASNLPINSCCDILRGHCSRAFSTTTVSSIERGATSVDVSARPALPEHLGHLRLVRQTGVGELQQLRRATLRVLEFLFVKVKR